MKRKKIIPAGRLTAARLRILMWFCAYPDKEFTLTEICTETNTAKKTAYVLLKDFFDKGFILEERIGSRIWRLSANPASDQFRRAKIALNLDLTYGSGIVERIKSAYPQARAIILFGSFRKGDDNTKSDLDIAIELSGRSKTEIVDFGKYNLAYRSDVPVHLFLFSRNSVDLNVFASIANGIVLDGFLEVKP